MFRKILSKLKNIKLIDRRKLYQYWEQEHLIKLIANYQVDCIFDVGANFGQYAHMLRKNVGYKGLILSFEPIPQAAEHLRSVSVGDPNWLIFDQALSVENGQQAFNVMSSSQFSSLSTPLHSEVKHFEAMNKISNTILVKTETLTSAFNRLKELHGFKNPFLKLDTQGYDVQIVQASKEVMPNFIGIQSELSIKSIYQHSVNYIKAIDLYQSLGFTLSAFVPNNAGHFPVLVETDCILINNAKIGQ